MNEDTDFFWKVTLVRLVSCEIAFIFFTILMLFVTPEPKLIIPAIVAVLLYTGYIIFWYFQFYRKAMKS